MNVLYSMPYLICLLLLLALHTNSNASPAITQQHSDIQFSTQTLHINTSKTTHHFTVEVADTPATRSHGLMFRNHLPSNQGMLFIFDQPTIINMWMKNTNISLDMLFIDNNNTIIDIAHQTTPHSLDTISPLTPAINVLEINGGLSRKLGIKTGDTIEILD